MLKKYYKEKSKYSFRKIIDFFQFRDLKKRLIILKGANKTEKKRKELC